MPAVSRKLPRNVIVLGEVDKLIPTDLQDLKGIARSSADILGIPRPDAVIIKLKDHRTPDSVVFIPRLKLQDCHPLREFFRALCDLRVPVLLNDARSQGLISLYPMEYLWLI
jgi:hypothetical protein